MKAIIHFSHKDGTDDQFFLEGTEDEIYTKGVKEIRARGCDPRLAWSETIEA